MGVTTGVLLIYKYLLLHNLKNIHLRVQLPINNYYYDYKIMLLIKIYMHG